MSTHTTGAAEKGHLHINAVGNKKASGANSGYITTMALVMMNVTIVAGIGNDVQQSFYGLSSITLFVIGAIVFFLPTGLVAAELASGWSQRGGIFRWVGEGMGKGWAFTCLLILWFQTTFNFGSGIPSASATIGFFTSDFDWAVDFAKNPSHTFWIMLGWLVYYWVICWIATKGVKVFAGVAKYGVLLGTFLPLAVMTILAVVWLAQGNKPNIEFTPQGLVPPWHGMTTLALAAGVLFSFAGIDMNAAHIKQLKNPRRQFPVAMFIAMVLSLVIFIVGTLIIAIVIPNKDINVLYTLFATYRELGETIGMPWLYLVFVYLGLGASLANLITNLAGPSYMLGQAGRSGFLPKALQNNNKHGMPSRLMYIQMAGMTLIAFVVFLLPNVEGFVILVTQAITILYMLYYVLMFISFLRLRYTQPNRPRTFVVPGKMVGAWIVSGVGLIACGFGITLALFPPSQVKKEVGSGVTYVTIILVIIAVVLLIAFWVYRLSRKHDWVDPSNSFAPFTWEIEGLKKPGKVLSNVPSEMLADGQNPMGMPIKRLFPPNQRIVLPAEYADVKHRGEPTKEELAAAKEGPGASGAAIAVSSDLQVQPPVSAPETTTAAAHEPPSVVVPPASAAEVAAAPVPDDPASAAAAALTAAKAAKEKAARLEVQAAALEQEADADIALSQAEQRAKAAHAAAEQAKLQEGAQPPSPSQPPSSSPSQPGPAAPSGSDPSAAPADPTDEGDSSEGDKPAGS